MNARRSSTSTAPATTTSGARSRPCSPRRTASAGSFSRPPEGSSRRRRRSTRTPPRTGRAKDIFLEARQRAGDDRSAYIRDRCAGDDDLRALVETLIRNDESETGFLDSPTSSFAGQAFVAADTPPERIGPYRIIKRLGEGGFGYVYLAEQTEPLKRNVALKILKPGLESGPILARFEAERQALAVMDHPSVARVFDAGITDDRRPYFVMEHVAGVPVNAYCHERQLGLDQRLELFIRICEAVQHAHQKGIIHRDLKPSNILVAEHEGKPAPKVIDFGIAKAIEQELTERTIFTERGQMIGTPEYMSPEQAEVEPLGIDTRTDVYSLGVVLYELLTGALPFNPQELRAQGYAEIQRIIREVDPPKPSTRIGTATTLDAPPETPTPKTRALARDLRGDLDWITMRCLEKERERRYDSVSDLAADIRRHLAHEPVSAGPPSAAYRAREVLQASQAARLRLRGGARRARAGDRVDLGVRGRAVGCEAGCRGADRACRCRRVSSDPAEGTGSCRARRTARCDSGRVAQACWLHCRPESTGRVLFYGHGEIGGVVLR